MKPSTSRLLKRLALLAFLLLLIGIIVLLKTVGPQLPVATGFVAKKLCSYHYISERQLDEIEKTEFTSAALNLVDYSNDVDNKSITTSLLGMAKSTAQYKKNLGCVLIHGDDDAQVSLDHTRSLSPSSIIPVSYTHLTLPTICSV